MQTQTPDLFDIINFESPQIQKFYDEALKPSQQTPQKAFRILPILASPFEFRLNFRKTDPNDLFNELLEQENRLKSPFSNQRTTNFSYNISQVFYNEMRRLQFMEKARTVIPIEPEKPVLKPEPEIVEKKPIEPVVEFIRKIEEVKPFPPQIGKIVPIFIFFHFL